MKRLLSTCTSRYPNESICLQSHLKQARHKRSLATKAVGNGRGGRRNLDRTHHRRFHVSALPQHLRVMNYIHKNSRIRNFSATTETSTQIPKELSSAIEDFAADDDENDDIFALDDDEDNSNQDIDAKDDLENPGYRFRGVLNNWYRANFDVSAKDAFETETLPIEMVDKESPSTQLWTATFVCPITGHREDASFLSGVPFFQEVDGKYYFPGKKYAIQAAARRAVVTFCPETGTRENKGVARSRLQAWYMKHHEVALSDENFRFQKTTKRGKKSGGTWWTASFNCPISEDVFPAIKVVGKDQMVMKDGTVWFRRRDDALQAAVASGLSAKDESSEVSPTDGYMTPSKTHLHKFYEKNYGVEVTDENFVLSTTSWKGSGGNQWTASFICPVTGRRFDSGTLRGENGSSKLDDIVWYTKKQTALIAAALHAYDILMFEKTGEKEFCFCHEDPEQDSGESDMPSSSDSTTIEPMLSTSQTIDTASKDDDGDDDDEDFVVQVVPRRIGGLGGKDSTRSTILDLVMQTWLESAQKEVTVEYESKTRHRRVSALESRRQAIQRANAWVSQQMKSVQEKTDQVRFDDNGFPNKSSIARVLLESLARAHLRLPTTRVESGVESTAKSIIDFLHSDSLAAPDADCYAFYIQCLEGDEITASKRAEKVFEEMIRGSDEHGNSLPQPNANVINSLMQRNAEAGIKTPISELDGLEVNRQTFLAALSAISHATGSRTKSNFDSLFVLDYVDRMKQLSSDGDDSFAVRIDVLNAPMRWSGAALHELSRPYSRCIDWDDIYTLYTEDRLRLEGFNELDPLVHEASDLQDWLNSIRKGAFGSDILPNIETYESVIQAWIRTGTLEGIDRSEKILEQLFVDRDVPQIRIQTLHPFLAALCFTGQVSRVDTWVAKMKERSDILREDSRIRTIQFLSRCSPWYDSSAPGTECALLLQKVLEDAKANSDLLEPHVFSMAIHAWLMQYESSGRKDAVECLAGTKEVVDEFDSTLRSFVQSTSEATSSLEVALMCQGPKVYCLAAKTIQKIDPLGFKAHHLHWIEKLVRRAEEHMILRESREVADLSESNEHVIHEDRFDYQYGQIVATSTSSWREFFTTIARMVSESNPTEYDTESDSLRLILLLSDISNRKLEAPTQIEEDSLYFALRRAIEQYREKHKSTVEQILSTLASKRMRPSSAQKVEGEKTSMEEDTRQGTQQSTSPRRRRKREVRKQKASRKPRKGPTRSNNMR